MSYFLKMNFWGVNNRFLVLFVLLIFIWVYAFLRLFYTSIVLIFVSLIFRCSYLPIFNHPSNNKCGSVCIYYKNIVPFRVLSVQYLQECISFELNIGGKTCNFISLYRFPSQTQNEFEIFIDNLGWNLETLCQNNPFFIVLIGDLNAELKNWYCHDKSSHEGNTIENVTAQFVL